MSADRQAPLLDDLYIVCSDIYGHRISLPPGDFDQDFVDAVDLGYQRATLHDLGNLVVDKGTGRAAFLVTVRIEDDTVLSDETLASISSLHGVDVAVLQVPDEGPCLPAYRVVAALLERTEQFPGAYALAADILCEEGRSKNIQPTSCRKGPQNA